MSISQIIVGPLWYLALAVFLIGAAWRLLAILFMGLRRDYSEARRSGSVGAIRATPVRARCTSFVICNPVPTHPKLQCSAKSGRRRATSLASSRPRLSSHETKRAFAFPCSSTTAYVCAWLVIETAAQSRAATPASAIAALMARALLNASTMPSESFCMSTELPYPTSSA